MLGVIIMLTAITSKAQNYLLFKAGIERGCLGGGKSYAGLAYYLSTRIRFILENSEPNTAARNAMLKTVRDYQDDYLNKVTEVNNKLEDEYTKKEDYFGMGLVGGLSVALNTASLLGTEHEDRSEETYKRLIAQKCRSATQ